MKTVMRLAGRAALVLSIFPAGTGVAQGPPPSAPTPAPSPAPAGPPGVLRISVADCVTMALGANRSVQKAYLQRISQRMNLRVAEHQFAPHKISFLPD